MRKIIILLSILFFPYAIFSQEKVNTAIFSSIRVLKVHQASLEKLSPFDEKEFEQIMRLNRKVKEELLKVLQLPEIVDFEKDSIPFFSTQTSDRNFAIFNWQENLGGTFQQYMNIFYWKNQNNTPKALLLEEEYAPYGSVFELKNISGEPLYLLIGGGTSCLTCIYEKALLLNPSNESLEEVFSYEINYQLNNDINGLSFDEATQTLNYEFIEEECEGDEGENCWVRGKFKFNGTTFVEIE